MSVGQGLVPEHAGAQSPQTRQTQKQGPHRIAVLPGDGIGKEVMPEALLVLEAVATKFGINLSLDHFDFASCDYYVKHGRMMPEDWIISRFGAPCYFFAVSLINTSICGQSA
jgi:isocitrate/isopropylmalate dehydrogenase